MSGGISDQQSHSDGGSAVTGSGTGADNVVQRDDDEDSEGAESAEVRAIMSDKKLEEVEETSPDTLPEPPRNYGGKACTCEDGQPLQAAQVLTVVGVALL